jgi:hypothetical protein
MVQKILARKSIMDKTICLVSNKDMNRPYAVVILEGSLEVASYRDGKQIGSIVFEYDDRESYRNACTGARISYNMAL